MQSTQIIQHAKTGHRLGLSSNYITPRLKNLILQVIRTSDSTRLLKYLIR